MGACWAQVDEEQSRASATQNGWMSVRMVALSLASTGAHRPPCLDDQYQGLSNQYHALARRLATAGACSRPTGDSGAPSRGRR